MAMIVTFAVLSAMSIVAEGHQHQFRGRALQNHCSVTAAREEEVRGNLREILDVIISGNQTQDSRLNFIEQRVISTYQALPKGVSGRLGPRSVRHLLRSYFAQEHGWTLVGLGRSEDLMGSSGNADVLRGSAPALMEAVLEAHEHGQGLTLAEVVSLARAVEKLAIEESHDILHSAYQMNGIRDDELLNILELKEVLVTFVAVLHQMQEEHQNWTEHIGWKHAAYSEGMLFLEHQFVMDSLRNFNYDQSGALSPFKEHKYDFGTAARIVDGMAYRMGHWHDESCQVMKEKLESLDTTGTGRVPLKDFYAANGVLLYVFDESIEDLREYDLLDESVPHQPAVRLANYVLSPSNCEQLSQHYDACCLTACTGIMNQLESMFRAPMADPELLISAVMNISHAGDEEFKISASPLLGSQGNHLRQSLRSIASHHGGEVPIHGRLFAIWLHFAFPRDCPLPSKVFAGENVKVSKEALQQVAPNSVASSELEAFMPSDSIKWAQEDEAALLAEIRGPRGNAASSWGRNVLRLLAMLGVCVAVVRVGFQYGFVAAFATSTNAKMFSYKKSDDYTLPLTF